MASQERSMPFIKNLASSDRKTRTAALTSLRTFLSSKQIATALSTLDTLKLWKGLFYALWMCDRPLPQQQLCTDLAELLYTLPADATTAPAVVSRWLRAFWATMAREWTTGIDVLRMEKFLLLVRRVLGASFVWMQVRETKTAAAKKRAASGKAKDSAAVVVRFDAARVEAVLALLADWPFRAQEEISGEEGDEGDELMPKMVPVGLRLHVLDIWVDEADKAGLLAAEDGVAEEEDQKNKKQQQQQAKGSLGAGEVLKRVNELVETLHAKTLSKAVRIRSKEALGDERLPWVEEAAEAETTAGDGEWLGFGN